jgi:transposase
MGAGHFTDDFKRDAVAQITDRGYPVAEVSKRLGVSQHSLYAWKRKFSKPSAPAGPGCGGSPPEGGAGTGHRGVRHPKKATAYFAKDAK